MRDRDGEEKESSWYPRRWRGERGSRRSWLPSEPGEGITYETSHSKRRAGRYDTRELKLRLRPSFVWTVFSKELFGFFLLFEEKKKGSEKYVHFVYKREHEERESRKERDEEELTSYPLFLLQKSETEERKVERKDPEDQFLWFLSSSSSWIFCLFICLWRWISRQPIDTTLLCLSITIVSPVFLFPLFICLSLSSHSQSVYFLVMPHELFFLLTQTEKEWKE